jgi:hypothetical protein
MSASTSSGSAEVRDGAAGEELRASPELVAVRRVVGVRERVAHRRVEEPVQRLADRDVVDRAEHLLEVADVRRRG